jgi:hypothetical protein
MEHLGLLMMSGIKWILMNYPVVNKHSYWKWPFSSLIYPSKMVIFHSYGTVYQRVGWIIMDYQAESHHPLINYGIWKSPSEMEVSKWENPRIKCWMFYCHVWVAKGKPKQHPTHNLTAILPCSHHLLI